MNIQFKHELGQKAKDKITNFEGILVARAEHLFGCNTYAIASQIYDIKIGKRGETEWFDEGRIEIVGEGISKEEVKANKPGVDFNHDNPKI